MTLPADGTVFAFFEANCPLSVYCFDCSFASGVAWRTHVLFIVTNRRKKSALILWNFAKHWVWTSSRRCFCSIESNRGTHLAHSFLMFAFLINMRCIAQFEMRTMFASSRNFSRRSFTTILWIFFTISVVVTSFGQPLRCSSWQLVRPRSKSATQYFIFVN